MNKNPAMVDSATLETLLLALDAAEKEEGSDFALSPDEEEAIKEVVKAIRDANPPVWLAPVPIKDWSLPA